MDAQGKVCVKGPSTFSVEKVKNWAWNLFIYLFLLKATTQNKKYYRVELKKKIPNRTDVMNFLKNYDSIFSELEPPGCRKYVEENLTSIIG